MSIKGYDFGWFKGTLKISVQINCSIFLTLSSLKSDEKESNGHEANKALPKSLMSSKVL